MTEYCLKQNDIDYLNQLHDNIVDTLDSFNHLMHKHDNDDEFDHIVTLINCQCELNKCGIIKNHRRNIRNNNNKILPRDQFISDKFNDDDTNMDNINNVKYWMNIIHRHYLHSYDMGYRLRRNERNNTNNLQQRCNLFRKKRALFHKSMQDESNNITLTNKFRSDLGKTKLSDNITSESKENENQISIEQYSYGYKLFYWDYHKKLTGQNNMYYVPSKYKDLKQELTENKIECIGIDRFNSDYKKALKYQKTEDCATIKADIDNYCPREMKMHIHPIHYGLNDSSPFIIDHIMSIMIYCNYDVKYCACIITNKLVLSTFH